MNRELFKKYASDLRVEIASHKVVYGLLLLAFVAGVFFRTYRLTDLLGFYYDQGRDALKVYEILSGNITLIGPTTGFDGIHRGPFFYYWLIPGYLLGNGNPAIVATYISFINALGILVIYACGAVFFSRVAGLIAATLIAVSYYATTSARWLSNPSPVWFFAPLALLFLGLAFKKSWKFLPFSAFCFGLTMQLEEAGMGFVLLAVAVYLLFHIKRLSMKQWIISFFGFAVTLTPILLFDVRNSFLNTNGLLKLILGRSEGDKSFGLSGDFMLKLRNYSGEFGKELFVNDNLHTFTTWSGVVVLLSLIGLLLAVKKYRRDQFFQLLFLWLLTPLGLLLFYQKPLYEYYIVGLYPIFFLLIGIGLSQFMKFKFGILAILIAVGITAGINKTFLQGYLVSKVAADSSTITFENQKKAAEYIYQSSEGKPLAVAVYVPPQLTYSYDYILPWYRKTYHKDAIDTSLDKATLFYTLHEEDHEHPKLLEERLIHWDTIGKTVDSFRMGGITVEKREIIKPENVDAQ